MQSDAGLMCKGKNPAIIWILILLLVTACTSAYDQRHSDTTVPAAGISEPQTAQSTPEPAAADTAKSAVRFLQTRLDTCYDLVGQYEEMGYTVDKKALFLAISDAGVPEREIVSEPVLLKDGRLCLH